MKSAGEPRKLAVVVDGAVVIGGRDHLVVVAVEPARVAVDAVADRLAVEELLQLGDVSSQPSAFDAACAPAMRPNVTPRITDVPDRVLVVVEPGHLAGGVEAGDRRSRRASRRGPSESVRMPPKVKQIAQVSG